MKKSLLSLIVFLFTTNLFLSPARSQLQNIEFDKQAIKAKPVASETQRDAQLEAAIRRQYSEAEKINYHYNRVDLNSDGQSEVLVHFSSMGYCGSGGCPVLIFQKRGQTYRLVTEIQVTGVPVIVTKQKTNGWYDLVVPRSLSLGGGTHSLMRFNGRTYPESPADGIAVRKNATISGIAFLSDVYSNPGLEF